MNTLSLQRSMDEALSDVIATTDFSEKFHLRVVADAEGPQTVSAVVARSGETVHLTWRNIMTSADIQHMRLERNHAGLPCINLIAKDSSIKKLIHWNKVERGKRIAILVDGEALLVTPISMQSGRDYRICAGLNSDELAKLMRLMKNGHSQPSG
jgi:hypothetical protein